MKEPLIKGICRGQNCRREIYWLPHPKTGKLHPYDDPDAVKSHFISCVDSPVFRNKKKSAKAAQ